MARKAHQTKESDSKDEEDHPPVKHTTDPKPAATKHRKKPPTVISSDSDLDDDKLGITLRTPPESPFYRAPVNHTTAAGMTKNNTAASTSTANKKERKGNTKQVMPNPKDPEEPLDQEKKNKKKRKARGRMEDLAEEEDKLYAELNKTAHNPK